MTKGMRYAYFLRWLTRMPKWSPIVFEAWHEPAKVGVMMQWYIPRLGISYSWYVPATKLI